MMSRKRISTTPHQPSQQPVRTPIGEEIRRTMLEVLEQASTTLTGRAFSPRIRLFDIEQVAAATGLGQSTIYRMMAEGRFPKPQRNLGKNLWRESSLIAWANANDPNSEL